MRFKLQGIRWEPRDIWIGVYWTKAGRTTTLDSDEEGYMIYVCIVPCLPLVIRVSCPVSAGRRSVNW